MPQPRRRILVTGGAGYIGAPTTRALVEANCDIHLLGRSDPAIAGTTFHRADLLEATDLVDLLKEIGASALLHLAWSVSPGKFWTDLANLDWTAASLRLFRAFAQAGGERIVGVGSCAEYDWSSSPLTETSSAIRPATLYGSAKASLWSLLEALGRQEGISVAWARIFFLYGPGEPRGKLVADSINALLARRTVATTAGTQKRDFLYIEDAAEALAGLALSSAVGPVNIASGEGVTVRGLLEQVEVAAQAAGLIDFGARDLARDEPMELVADVSRLKDELGFVPRFSVAEGLARTVAWWRERPTVGTQA